MRPVDVALRAVTWSPDGRHLIAGAYDGTLLAVDAERPVWQHTDAALRPGALAVGGPVLAAASFRSRPCLLEAATGVPLSGGAGAPAGAAVPPVVFRDGVVAAAGRVVTAGPPGAAVVVAEHDLRVGALDVLADRVVASAAHHAVRLTRLTPFSYDRERGVTVRCPEPVRAVALLGTPEATVVVAASYDFRLYLWTVDWSGPPVGPRLAGESGAGIAALQRLDEHRLTATDHRGELMILALGADGALSF